MKLIIDIPEEIYIEKKEDYIGDTLDKAIANGIPLSEELEKIKAEIEDRYHKEMIKRHLDNGYDYQDLLLVGIDIGKNIVDRHIVELKGEQNNDTDRI